MSAPEESGVVIVGASIAGITCAQALRSEGYDKRITLVGAEKQLPYNRPPLSKQVLAGKWNENQTFIDSQEKFDELGFQFYLEESALSVDVAAQEVRTDSRKLRFDELIIATGASARSLPNTANFKRVHVLRNIDDALSLRQSLDKAKSAVVIGAGVLGSEVVSNLRERGIETVLIDRMPEPQLPLTGGHFSSRINALLEENHVKTKFGVDVVAVSEDESKITFTLSDGSTIDGDIAVIAIGCYPNTDWLRDSGIDVSNGVLCDSKGLAAPHIFAIGDVARWTDVASGKAMRLENQTSAIEQGLAVAKFIATGDITPASHPFFWSEIFGNKILMLGNLDSQLPLTIVQGSTSENRFVAATIRDGVTTGIVGWNMPREFRQTRSMMEK